MAHPVFIFLPVMESSPDDDGGALVDPVCGRGLWHGAIAGRLVHDGRHHYFCSLSCAARFASDARERDAE